MKSIQHQAPGSTSDRHDPADRADEDIEERVCWYREIAWSECRGKRVLDLGCGDGETTRLLASNAASAVGADLRDVAGEDAGRADDVSIVDASCSELPFDDASFDVVVAHALPKRRRSVGGDDVTRAILAEVQRCLAPDGVLVCHTFDFDDDPDRLESLHTQRLVEAVRPFLPRIQHVAWASPDLVASDNGEATDTPRLAALLARPAEQAAGTAATGGSSVDPCHTSAERADGNDDSAAFSLTESTQSVDGAAGDMQETTEQTVERVVRSGLPRPSETTAEPTSVLTPAPRRGPKQSEANRSETNREPAPATTAAAAHNGRSPTGRRMAGAAVRTVARSLGLRPGAIAPAGGSDDTTLPLTARLARAVWRTLSSTVLWSKGLRPDIAKALGLTRGLFDAGYYRRRYYDVSHLSDRLCAIHFATVGWREGRRPGRLFDTEFYLNEYPDVRDSGTNPLLHYVVHGAAEWRAPNEEMRNNSKVLAGNDWTIDATPPDPLTSEEQFGREEADDPWVNYENFRAYIGDRRRTKRHAWAPKPCPMVRIDPDDITGGVRRIDRLARTSTTATPDVSIVIPVYDELHATLECLLSIAKHTGGNDGIEYEIIVVDDCSSEHTGEVLSSVRSIRYVRQPENRGFGPTCNRGIEEAKGRVVVLLNSDAQVSANWLPPLIERLDTTDGDGEPVGMVGPKLLFPQGLLQEAGGRLKPDGSGAMVGLHEDPDAPRFSYAREVDYVSAACAVMRREDFLRLGGFDDAYAPAYCEDADLCMKVRAAGMSVYYEPESRIVHHLSKTTRSAGQLNKVSLAFSHQSILEQRWSEDLEARDKVRLIAFYLPQFHTIPENDRWWGQGFTEWRNVAKAKPRFRGHYQPRQPADFGFYDLRIPGTLQKQAALAQRYGLHAFCFYYYRLDGRRILDMPMEQILQDENWTMPFTLCWANENWTRRWDGQDSQILLTQEYGPDADRAMIEDFIRYFEHPAFMRVNGKPLVLVYRPLAMPDPRATTDLWRDVCRERGIGEIYIVAVESNELMRTPWNPMEHGYDASVEFPPHEAGQPIDIPRSARAADYTGTVHDYRRVVEAYCTREMPGYKRLRGIMPGWDNTSRRKFDSHVFVNNGPAEYQTWLEYAIEDTRTHLVGEERMVFINAWNEWAESAYLEPDLVYGHAFLQATRNAVEAERVRG